jgi:hypothetical protein
MYSFRLSLLNAEVRPIAQFTEKSGNDVGPMYEYHLMILWNTLSLDEGLLISYYNVIVSDWLPLPVIWHRWGSRTATQFQPLVCCVMSWLTVFFGKVIRSAVQNRLVNLHVNCVRRSGWRCSGTRGRLGWRSMGHVAILQGSIGYACGPVLMIPPRVKG